MITVDSALSNIHKEIGKDGRLAFIASLITGTVAHMSALVSDFPNHDGLSSMYFDQNMITSGRWFLVAACAPTSFFSLPWITGIVALLYIAIAAILTVKILKIENPCFIVLTSALITVFPSLSSNFAYVFTMDGYMMGMLFCVSAVWLVERAGKFGWLFGAVMLALGMGCYQSYLCITMILCLYTCAVILLKDEKPREKLIGIGKYFMMGVIGVILYYVVLRILLVIQGKVLDTYQGINTMSSGNGRGLIGTVSLMYTDFVKFTFGKVTAPGTIAGVSLFVTAVVALVCFVRSAANKGVLKKPLFYVFSLLFLSVLPCAMNAILLISTDVTYHVLMRFQWAFLIAIMMAVIDHGVSKDNFGNYIGWAGVIFCTALVCSYIVTDNIAYSNLNKKYEKTYAYCLRLADRIEQTEGYYSGIPVALVGVVGNDSFPETDITGDVTGALLGVSGDYLLYKPENYRDFYKYYLGITFNILGEDEVAKFYNEDFYAEMESFPGKTSVLLHDGVIYVKTENIR